MALLSATPVAGLRCKDKGFANIFGKNFGHFFSTKEDGEEGRGEGVQEVDGIVCE